MHAECIAGPRLSMVCRIIAENFLEGWWENLDETLSNDKHVDTQTIHRIVT